MNHSRHYSRQHSHVTDHSLKNQLDDSENNIKYAVEDVPATPLIQYDSSEIMPRRSAVRYGTSNDAPKSHQ